jgi:uncharacterized protein
VNIEEVRELTENNIQLMIEALPKSLEERENEFFRKMEKSNLSRLKKLEKIYSFMDILYKHVHKYTPCKKHCSYCCSYDVTISDIEIEYIEKRNKKVKRKKTITTKSKGAGTPCLFLTNDLCTIYHSRPYVCRRHVMLTPDSSICTKNNAYKYELRLLTFTEIDKSYDFIRANSNSTELYEIRDVFQNKKNIIKLKAKQANRR